MISRTTRIRTNPPPVFHAVEADTPREAPHPRGAFLLHSRPISIPTRKRKRGCPSENSQPAPSLRFGLVWHCPSSLALRVSVALPRGPIRCTGEANRFRPPFVGQDEEHHPIMNHEKSLLNEAIVIGGNHWDVPLRVELRAYLRFSRRMDMQLRRLVVRWSHAATPQSRVEGKGERGEGEREADRTEIGKKGTGPICAKHPPGRSGKLDLSPFSLAIGGRAECLACPWRLRERVGATWGATADRGFDNRSRANRGLVHFSARESVLPTRAWPKTWTCPPPVAPGGTVPFSRRSGPYPSNALCAAKIGTVPCER